jgi:hypothetical protein
MSARPSDIQVYDHFRPGDGADLSEGVYRVVGVRADEVTLLRVGDPDGRRVNTGEVVTVDRATAERFDSAANPDGTRSLAGTLRSAASSAVWSVRAFLQKLAARPLLSTVAIALLLAGRFGEGALGLPEPAGTVLVVLGTVGLVLVASGRL